MVSFGKMIISGVVTVAPEERWYGINNTRRMLELVVLVEQQGREGAPRRSPFRVAVYDEGLMALCSTLALNQRVVVAADVYNEQWMGKDGKMRDSFRLTARNIVPGQAFAAGAGRPAEQGSRGGTGWTPPRNAREAMERRRSSAPTPPPVSQEEDEDIPF